MYTTSARSAMDTTFTIVRPVSGDWEALYINGNLAAEGHSLSVSDVLDCINGILPNIHTCLEIPDEVAEVGMPQRLDELGECDNGTYLQK